MALAELRTRPESGWTDTLNIPCTKLEEAVEALRAAGFEVSVDQAAVEAAVSVAAGEDDTGIDEPKAPDK
jgi:hypothetical protein